MLGSITADKTRFLMRRRLKRNIAACRTCFLLNLLLAGLGAAPSGFYEAALLLQKALHFIQRIH
ncbi:hypothetical protein D3C80_2155460 [compost metagenome]